MRGPTPGGPPLAWNRFDAPGRHFSLSSPPCQVPSSDRQTCGRGRPVSGVLASRAARPRSPCSTRPSARPSGSCRRCCTAAPRPSNPCQRRRAPRGAPPHLAVGVEVGVEPRHAAARRLQLHQRRHRGVVVCARESEPMQHSMPSSGPCIRGRARQAAAHPPGKYAAQMQRPPQQGVPAPPTSCRTTRRRRSRALPRHPLPVEPPADAAAGRPLAPYFS